MEGLSHFVRMNFAKNIVDYEVYLKKIDCICENSISTISMISIGLELKKQKKLTKFGILSIWNFGIFVQN
jgi:hypothetical protein